MSGLQSTDYRVRIGKEAGKLTAIRYNRHLLGAWFTAPSCGGGQGEALPLPDAARLARSANPTSMQRREKGAKRGSGKLATQSQPYQKKKDSAWCCPYLRQRVEKGGKRGTGIRAKREGGIVAVGRSRHTTPSQLYSSPPVPLLLHLCIVPPLHVCTASGLYLSLLSSGFAFAYFFSSGTSVNSCTRPWAVK